MLDSYNGLVHKIFILVIGVRFPYPVLKNIYIIYMKTLNDYIIDDEEENCINKGNGNITTIPSSHNLYEKIKKVSLIKL